MMLTEAAAVAPVAVSVTASLDAALALVEEKLPGQLKFFGDLDPSDTRAVANLGNGYPDSIAVCGFAPRGCYAIALSLALVRALIAKEQTDAG